MIYFKHIFTGLSGQAQVGTSRFWNNWYLWYCKISISISSYIRVSEMCITKLRFYQIKVQFSQNLKLTCKCCACFVFGVCYSLRTWGTSAVVTQFYLRWSYCLCGDPALSAKLLLIINIVKRFELSHFTT